MFPPDDSSFNLAAGAAVFPFRKYRQHCDNHHNDKQEDGRANATTMRQNRIRPIAENQTEDKAAPPLRSEAPAEDESKNHGVITGNSWGGHNNCEIGSPPRYGGLGKLNVQKFCGYLAPPNRL